MEDSLAVALAKSGDGDAYRTLVERYSRGVFRLAYRMTGNEQDAEDVVQEAFVRFWRHQRGLPGEPMALLVTSVRRAAIDLARRDDRRAAREERVGREDIPAFVVFESSFDGDERREAIAGALQRLPAAQREVLVLKIWGELTFDQIAAELALSPNTAASRYRYALAALRQELIAADCHG